MRYLGEKCVEAVHFLAFFDEGVILRDAFEGQIIHQVDLIRVLDELVLECFHRHRKGSREETYLPGWRCQVDELLQQRLELRRQQLVRLHVYYENGSK